MSSQVVWRTRKVTIQDLYSFPLEVSLEDAELLNELRWRVRSQERVWQALDASKGPGWYIQSDVPRLSLSAYNRTKVLKKLIRKGIPPARRPSVWLATSGAEKKRSTVPKSYYSDLIEAVKDKVTDATRQIDHDLPRSFPTHPWLGSEEGYQSLRRVLVAYSFRDSRVGYCQGMNYIVGYLLLVMKSEEDAFWMLAVLLEDVLLSDLHSDNLYGCQIENRVFKELIKQKCPRLAAHFVEIECDVELVTTKWFLCLFSRCLPSETTMRVWDVLFNEGADILFMVALTIFKIKEDRLLAATQPGEAIKILLDTAQGMYDPEILLKIAYEGLGFLTTYAIARNRKKQHPVVTAELEQIFRRQESM